VQEVDALRTFGADERRGFEEPFLLAGEDELVGG
jgi:hypothetical protein